MSGDRRVGLPWQTIGAFLRISTHPRIAENPLSPSDAWRYVEAWLAAGPVWVPSATERTAAVQARLIEQHDVSSNLVTDAQLAALAIEHGLTVISADSDFTRFDTCPGTTHSSSLTASSQQAHTAAPSHTHPVRPGVPPAECAPAHSAQAGPSGRRV